LLQLEVVQRGRKTAILLDRRRVDFSGGYQTPLVALGRMDGDRMFRE
jgi:hypothetical protein